MNPERGLGLARARAKGRGKTQAESLPEAMSVSRAAASVRRFSDLDQSSLLPNHGAVMTWAEFKQKWSRYQGKEACDFTNDHIDRPENLRNLRAAFENPEFLKPHRTTAEFTKKLAEKFAEVARSLHRRESAELADALTRAEVNVAQRKSLRIARFLNRLIFCFFAEDTALLPRKLFSELARTALDDPHHLSQALELLFRAMATGGLFGAHKICRFNGHLFRAPMAGMRRARG